MFVQGRAVMPKVCLCPGRLSAQGDSKEELEKTAGSTKNPSSSAFSGLRVGLWKEGQFLNSSGWFSYDLVKRSVLRTWGFIQVSKSSFPLVYIYCSEISI